MKIICRFKRLLHRNIFGATILLPDTSDREGVIDLEYLALFVIAVVAGVVVHIIGKWLDSDK